MLFLSIMILVTHNRRSTVTYFLILFSMLSLVGLPTVKVFFLKFAPLYGQNILYLHYLVLTLTLGQVKRKKGE